MRKNKLHTFINVGGMTVAFACSVFILLLVYRHFTYDNFELNKDKLYKVYDYAIGPNGEETATSMPYPLTPALKAENIGIEKATRIFQRGKLVRYKDKTIDMSTTMVDPDFLNMFTFRVVKGNAINPLSDVSNTVITEKTAGKLFDKEDPIGKNIEVRLGADWYRLTVAAVVKDPPANSTIKFSLLARTELNPDYPMMQNLWDSRNHSVYVQLANNTTEQQVETRLRSFVKKYTPVDVALEKKSGYKEDKNGDYSSLRLLPFTQEHFNSQIGSGGTVSKAFLYTLLLISFVIILIASFNFVNLNVGLSFTRTKEMGIRKCLGAGKRQVWLQVWGESFMMVLISMLLAIAVVYLLIRNFNKTFDNSMDAGMLFSPAITGILILLVLAVSLIASGYPSSIMASLKTVEILKGKISIKKPGMLRNALIVTQFVIAIVLMCCTIIIFQQFNYVRAAPLGYNTTSIISIPIKDNINGKDIIDKMRTRLASQSSVIAVSGSNANLGLGEDGSTSTSVMCFTYGDKNICGQVINGDYDFLKALGINPVSGRDFSADHPGDTGTAVIATESYAAQFGKNDIAGFSYYPDSALPKITIVGIIPDFKLNSIKRQQKPLVISLSSDKNLSYVWIKVITSNPTVTMNMIKNVYSTVEPGVEFKGSFVNENIDRLYRDEQMMAKLFSIAACIAIILSCMGLFGMASIIIRQRVKEIGVRKVLGATVNGIVTLVSKEFIRPVLIAILIAIPIGWWIMSAWLQDFAYRVNIHWWVFGIAGFVAILISILTISFQAIKAARANPVQSLRTE
jgi:ABC-type antimicrobial peptide transport system permease subunit